MSKAVTAAAILVLMVIAMIWVLFPLDGTSENGQPPPHAIDQSN
nr:hypothetical protein [Ensifer sp. IC4062]